MPIYKILSGAIGQRGVGRPARIYSKGDEIELSAEKAAKFGATVQLVLDPEVAKMAAEQAVTTRGKARKGASTPPAPATPPAQAAAVTVPSTPVIAK